MSLVLEFSSHRRNCRTPHDLPLLTGSFLLFELPHSLRVLRVWQRKRSGLDELLKLLRGKERVLVLSKVSGKDHLKALLPDNILFVRIPRRSEPVINHLQRNPATKTTMVVDDCGADAMTEFVHLFPRFLFRSLFLLSLHRGANLLPVLIPQGIVRELVELLLSALKTVSFILLSLNAFCVKLSSNVISSSFSLFHRGMMHAGDIFSITDRSCLAMTYSQPKSQLSTDWRGHGSTWGTLRVHVRVIRCDNAKSKSCMCISMSHLHLTFLVRTTWCNSIMVVYDTSYPIT